MIEVDLSTALVLYLFAYLGIVLIFWCRYEWKRRNERGPDHEGDKGARSTKS